MRNFGTPDASPDDTLPAQPLPNCYWVIPGKLLAGEHPGGDTPDQTNARLERLMAAGIECFVDLTMPDELDGYDICLPIGVEYIRKPIKDHGLPGKRAHMIEIQACIEQALRTGMATYVHCRAGIGRTGMAVGCFLVERGRSGPEALDELNQLWKQCKRSLSWPHVPETDEQKEYVRNWIPQVAAVLAPVPALKPTEDPIFETEALSAARSLRDRFQGALMGLAVGDALAATTQYRKPGSFPQVGDMLGGGPFDLPRGGWSDDTAMALCLAESLVETSSFDAREQVDRYTRWQQQGYLSATGQCLGITANTARALAMAKWRRQMFSGSHDPTQLDPEVLSRIAPTAMFFFATPANAVTYAADAARTTCQAAAVIEACRLMGALMYGALAGKSKTELLTPPADLLDLDNLRTDVAVLVDRLDKGSPIPPRAGNVLEALEAALWAFRSTNNFRDGALKAVNLGENSDVVAAVYGQLAGAHYGVNAIPATWRNSLMDKDLIESLGDRLLAHAMVGLSD